MVNYNETERHILKIAEEQFVKNGFENTNMSDIAAEAGINRTALHYYFRTKEKMFQAVFANVIDSFLPKLQVIFEEDTLFFNKIEKIIDEYINIFKENSSLPYFVLSEIQRDVNHLIKTMEYLGFDTYFQAFEKVILKEMEEKRIKTVPIPFILLTFYSQLTFPFLMKNMLSSLLEVGRNKSEFGDLLEEWKKNLLGQMRALLEN